MRRAIKIIVFLAFLSGLLLIVFFKIKNDQPGPSGTNDNFTVPFEMPPLSETSFPERICDIKDYGSFSDGITKNTEVFAKAISDCSGKGGGVVNIPPGIWLTGPIHLKSNINLHLEKGAEIRFSTDINDYSPSVFSRFEGIEYYNYSPLIYAKDAENIAITGEGEINGQEEFWQKNSEARQASIDALHSMVENNLPVEKRDFGDKKYLLQPSFIQFVNCDKILIEGVKIKNSPNWTIHPIYSQNIILRDLDINNTGPNTDGIVIDSSENALIENCRILSGDDAIAIKSGTDTDGLRVNKPSKNIIVRGCEILKAHSGLAIGSEMSGGVKNVLVENLQIKHTQYGIRLKSTPGRGGIVENIWINNTKIDRALYDAIRLDLKYRLAENKYSQNELPIFKNIYIENFYCRRAKNAIVLIGLPESPLENISLKNINISASNTEIISENIQNKKLEKVKINKN